MKTFKVKLALRRKNITVKVEFGRSVHDAMNGNANFTSQWPTLAALKTATDTLEAAYIERQSGAHLAVSQMHVAEEVFDVLMTALGAYVNSVARGSESLILSAGMETKKQKAPVGIPAKVENLRARPLDVAGTVRLLWKKVYGAFVYNVYVKADGESDEHYKLIAQPTGSRLTLDGLQSGVYYNFKVEAIGYAGKGALSDPARVIAF
jgi:hypothetical protein